MIFRELWTGAFEQVPKLFAYGDRRGSFSSLVVLVSMQLPLKCTQDMCTSFVKQKTRQLHLCAKRTLLQNLRPYRAFVFLSPSLGEVELPPVGSYDMLSVHGDDPDSHNVFDGSHTLHAETQRA